MLLVLLSGVRSRFAAGRPEAEARIAGIGVAMPGPFGVAIADAELVGPVPLQALEDVVRYCLQVRSFSTEQIVESHLLG